MVKYCPKCGYPNPDDAKFCMKCGYQLPTILQQPSPNSQPPSIPTTPPEQPKKELPLKAIIGLVVAAIVVLVVFIVVLPLISPYGSTHGISTLASTAQSNFGGSWVTARCLSGTVTYVGNGEYKVSYLNGTTITVKNISNIPFILYSFSCTSSSTATCNVTLSKAVFALINGTINGNKAYILVIGDYWNTTPNPIYDSYNQIKSDLSNGGGLILLAKAIFNAEGVCFNASIHNGMVYVYSSASNSTSAESLILHTPTPDISALLSQIKLTSVNALGVLREINANEEIVVIVINMAPSESQMIPVASQVEGCL
ncbi:zinc ribbon domain-containing protein [Acidianus infernus]|uniref:zinc ribbon domain-containing protein n=1 Tax=Acidianus infernus TaxID=12915 RepID=UPI003594585D